MKLTRDMMEAVMKEASGLIENRTGANAWRPIAMPMHPEVIMAMAETVIRHNEMMVGIKLATTLEK